MNTTPPHDHDRPTPPEDRTDDPIETVLRIGELRAEIEKTSGAPLAEGMAPGTPLKMQEAFWQQVLDFENAPQATVAAILRQRRSFQPIPIQELDADEKLHVALWELINALASIRYFLHFTDHLSDRELYRLLLEEVLPKETTVFPENSEWNTRCHIVDFPTLEFPDSTDCWLAYYADDETRALWTRDFPETVLPSKRKPPHDRDSHLPDPDR